MDINIEDILNDSGPMLSSSVIQKLCESGVSKVAARQRVARTAASVHRITHLQFPHRSRFLYLPGQYKKPIYWENLSHVLNASPLYACSINALRVRGGMMPRYLFDLYSGSPVFPLKSHQVSETILERLLRAEVLTGYSDPSMGPFIAINESIGDRSGFPEIRTRLLAESVLLAGIKQWIRNTGIASYQKVQIRDGNSLPNFGKFSWDLVAPSYVHPFRSTLSKEIRPKPGFFVCDILLTKDLSIDHINFFLKKCNVLRIQRNTRPFMSMLLAEGYQRDAFAKGKAAGIILTTPRILLGDQVADCLRSLIELLNRQATASGEAIHQLFSKLSKIEGAAQNLRGPLFELVVARLVSVEHGGSLDISRRVIDPASGDLVEIDVFLVCRGREVKAYECKGKEPGGVVSESEVEKWAKGHIPKVRSWISSQSRFSDYDLHFEFWTAGDFSPDAINFLKSTKSRTKKYQIAWKNGSEVLAYAHQHHEKRICDLLREQFIKHPLVTQA
ncbi:MAG: hypothetical protein ABSH06_27710 [Thermodesulfobacteriota bacterium]